METPATILDRQFLEFSTDDSPWIKRIMHSIEENKDDENIKIYALPENNDGCLYCVLPKNWLHINPPRKVKVSEEQKQAAAIRLAEYRAAKKRKAK